ncbi:MAG: hypothetical protein KGI51_07580 [Rhodospirillales bacterium]|nr:hypothetical protein [Rhodospirillales bacterium]
MSHVAERIRPATSPRIEAARLFARRTPLILVVEDTPRISEAIREISTFLGVAVERIGPERELLHALRDRRPMAVIAELDAPSRDGCHVMMEMAEYDRNLPLMLLTGPSQVLAGAADAVEELCALRALTLIQELPPIGGFVEFVFRAGQSGQCLGLLPL